MSVDGMGSTNDKYILEGGLPIVSLALSYTLCIRCIFVVWTWMRKASLPFTPGLDDCSMFISSVRRQRYKPADRDGLPAPDPGARMTWCFIGEDYCLH